MGSSTAPLCDEAGPTMNDRIITVVLLVAGVALAAWGYDVYDSAGAQLSRTLSGDTPIEAWLGLGGGAVCVILGLLRLK
jgi:hypothetical protein